MWISGSINRRTSVSTKMAQTNRHCAIV